MYIHAYSCALEPLFLYTYVHEAGEGSDPGDGAGHVVHVGHGREEGGQLNSIHETIVYYDR